MIHSSEQTGEGKGAQAIDGADSADPPDLETDALKSDGIALARTGRAQRLVVERQAPRRRAFDERLIQPQAVPPIPAHPTSGNEHHHNTNREAHSPATKRDVVRLAQRDVVVSPGPLEHAQTEIGRAHV